MSNQSQGLWVLEAIVPKPERFNSMSIGTYTHPKNQKTIFLKNANGQQLAGGFTMDKLIHTLNPNKPFDAQVITFLNDHPKKGVDFKLTNTAEKKKAGEDLLMLQLEIEGKLKEMDYQTLKKICSLLNYTYNEPKNTLLAKLVRRVRTENKKDQTQHGVYKVKEAIESRNGDILFDLKEMLHHNLIKKKASGVYVYNEYSLGLSFDQMILYMDQNQDVYAGLKLELRKLRPQEEVEDTLPIID